MELLINGKRHQVDAHASESLLDVLRNQVGFTGSKYGCGEAVCGACKVLIEGVATPSCITLVGSLNGKAITTIEGLSRDGRLHPVQRACIDVDVFQCAYCASGMIITAASLLEKNAHPTEEEIVQYMQGNICRCGTYPRIVKAIQAASTL